MKEAYKELISSVIKKEKRIVKDIAISSARDIDGLEIDDEGNVEKLEREGKEVFEDLYSKYKELGFGTAKVIIKKAIEPVMEEHPDLEIPEELS